MNGWCAATHYNKRLINLKKQHPETTKLETPCWSVIDKSIGATSGGERIREANFADRRDPSRGTQNTLYSGVGRSVVRDQQAPLSAMLTLILDSVSLQVDPANLKAKPLHDGTSTASLITVVQLIIRSASFAAIGSRFNLKNIPKGKVRKKMRCRT